MPPRVSAADIARCGRMSSATRRQWALAGLLERGGTLTEHDAVETAVAARLIEATTTQRARAAFRAVRADLRAAVIAGERQLWVIVPHGGQDFALARSDRDALAIAGSLVGPQGPVWTVFIAAAIADAQTRYKQCLEAEGVSGAAVRSLRSADGGGEA
jgi:hypothetical protein